MGGSERLPHTGGQCVCVCVCVYVCVCVCAFRFAHVWDGVLVFSGVSVLRLACLSAYVSGSR